MKVFTTGTSGFVSQPVAEALGLTAFHNQAEVLVVGRSKAEAFNVLAQYALAPTSVRDPEFRVASGDAVDALTAADEYTGGLFPAGAVLVVHPTTQRTTPVLRLHDASTFTVIGKLERDGSRLVFAPAKGVDVTNPVPPAPPYQFSRGFVVADLAAQQQRIARLEAELDEARRKRNQLCRLAVRVGAVDEAAAVLGVTVPRVYQLSDKSLIEQAQAAQAAADS